MESKKISPKMMPHNIEAEQAVLGACLIDGEAAISIMNNVKKEDFYLEARYSIQSLIDTGLSKPSTY